MVQASRPLGLLLSIHPRWVDLILDGRKTVEIRRRPPREAAPGLPVLLYATAPVRAVVARAELAALRHASREELWLSVGRQSALAEHEFLAYLEGAPFPGGLAMSHVQATRSVALAWRPPQSWMWLRAGRSQHEELLRHTSICPSGATAKVAA